MNQDSAKPASDQLAAVWLRGMILLAVILVAVYPLFAWYGYSRYGWDGVLSATLGGVVCLTAALIGFFAMVAIPNVSGILLAMLIRMALPMVAGIVLSSQGGRLADANVFGFILVYYFVMLVVETPLSLRLVQSRSADPPQTPKAG